MFYFYSIFSFLLLTRFAGAVSGDAEIQLSVVKGGNLVVYNMSPRSKHDQLMFSQFKGVSERLIAQMSCNDNNCTNESEPGFVIRCDAQSVTIMLVNATCNQTGLYRVHAHRATRFDNPTYNISVFGSTPRTIAPKSPPSFVIGDPVAAGIGATVGILVLALIIIIIGTIYFIYCRKKMYWSVPDTVP